MVASTLAAAALSLVAVSGCNVVSDPPKSKIVQDVEFLRGCWVSKAGPNGPVTGFLRLLPERADGPSYQGYGQRIEGGDIKSATHLSFMRDGSSMTIRSVRGGTVEDGGISQRFAPLPAAVLAGLPKVAHRTSYAVRSADLQASWIVAEGGNDTIRIRTLGDAGQHVDDLFQGERDGCD